MMVIRYTVLYIPYYQILYNLKINSQIKPLPRQNTITSYKDIYYTYN